jgi:cyd operon protein YbgT
MWYFSWILGVGLAVGFGIINGVWHEFHTDPNDEATVLD